MRDKTLQKKNNPIPDVEAVLPIGDVGKYM